MYPGDKIIFQTAGAGGWGDPLERGNEAVRRDVVRRLVSIEVAREFYGVVLDPVTLQIETKETDALRHRIRSTQGAPTVFDFGKQVTGELGSVTS